MLNMPYPFQMKGIWFTEQHNGRVLIADEMGVGKSIQAIGWSVLHQKKRPVIVVCPATVKYKWQREWRIHAGIRSFVCSGKIGRSLESRIEAVMKKKWKHAAHKRRAIRRARVQHRKAAKEEKRVISMARKHEVVIINYDILQDWQNVLISMNPQIFIVDECHYTKGRSRIRTKSCRIVAKHAPHIIALSGTPIAGRPSEFFPILQMIRPDEFTSFWKYAFEYCAPRRNRWSGGWDFSGAANLEALHRRLKPIMIRRLRKMVLPDLPPKIRTITPIEIENRAEYDKAETDFLTWLLENKGAQAYSRAARAETIVRMNGLRMLAASGKMKYAIRWISEWMESTDRKLIVFAIHKEIIQKLERKFPGCVVIDGRVSNKPGRRGGISPRQKLVDKFQVGDARLLIGQLRAAGEGIDLTAASDVLFLEIGWSPGEHDQAEDRALRIGQKNKVQINYVVGKDTIESKLLSIIEEKDHTVGHILDGRGGGSGLKRLVQSYLQAARRRRRSV